MARASPSARSALSVALRRQALGVDHQLQHRAGAARPRPLEGRGEARGPLHPLGMEAVGRGDRDEVRIDDVGEADAAGIGALLVHADGPVAAIVDDEDDRRDTRLQRAAELLHRHLEVAVAGEADDAGVGAGDLRRDRRGQAVAHRPRLRPEQAHPAGEARCLFDQIEKLPAPLVRIASAGSTACRWRTTAPMSSPPGCGGVARLASQAAWAAATRAAPRGGAGPAVSAARSGISASGCASIGRSAV